ncbi:MAG: TolC family protein [Candidatus Acidiferrales bacterium]
MKYRLAAVVLILTIFSPAAKNPLSAQIPAGPVVAPSGNSGSSTTTSSSPAPASVASPAAAQGQSSFTGSVPSPLVPGVLPISLEDAINRGLKQNLGLLLSSQDVGSARGQRWQQLSSLLPNLTTTSYVDQSQINLAEFGFSFKIPNASIPSVVGPFTYYDSRAYVTQSVFDWKAINNTHSASQNVKAAQYTVKDARDLVVLAVGYNYLQAIADEARIETAEAQVNTGQALYNQAADQLKAGTSPAIDELRAHVELQTRQQQLIQAKNDLAIQKLIVARVIGLAPGQEFDLTDKSPYEPLEGITVEDALKRAYATRSDFQAALATVSSEEYSRRAAHAGYYPSLSVSGDYGVAGTYSNLFTHGVFDMRATLNIPIFQGGKVHGDVLVADAQLQQSRDRLESLRAQIDADVRTALFNLESSAQQVVVAKSNVGLADESLRQSRDRFAAGVTNTVEVVQAQEAVASAHENYISALYSYNYSKIALARAIGFAEEGVKQYFKGK